MAPLYDALFRKHELEVEAVATPLGPLAEGDSPWARLLRGLFLRPTAPPLCAPGELTESQLPSRRCPARAPRPVRWRGGSRFPRRRHGSGAIAVVAQTGERRQGLIEALSRYAVPVYAPPPLNLLGESRLTALPPPLQALLGLFETVTAGLPREGLIQAMTSRYLRFPGPSAEPALAGGASAARRGRTPACAAARVRPRPAAAGQPVGAADAAQRRLSPAVQQWLRQQALEQRPGGAIAAERQTAPRADEPLPEPLAAVARQVDAVVRELLTLPESASPAAHCAALRRLAERWQLTERALGAGWEHGEDELAEPLHCAEDAEEDRQDDGAAAALLAASCLAQARDQAAVAALFKFSTSCRGWRGGSGCTRRSYRGPALRHSCGRRSCASCRRMDR